MKKISQFPVSDPQVVNLSSSSGKARQMLTMMMIDHINSGRRTKRLNPRVVFEETTEEVTK